MIGNRLNGMRLVVLARGEASLLRRSDEDDDTGEGRGGGDSGDECAGMGLVGELCPQHTFLNTRAADAI